MKRCSVCHRLRRRKYFSPRRACKDGLDYRCKACQAARSRQYHADHRPRVTARMRNYHTPHRTQGLARSRRYAACHRERATAKNHYRFAHTPTMWQFKYYKRMTFYSKWDTEKRQPRAATVFAANAERWMKIHLPCPGRGWDLHVDKTPKHPFGYFGPGGFRWLQRADVHQKLELSRAIQIVEAAGYTLSRSHE